MLTVDEARKQLIHHLAPLALEGLREHRRAIVAGMVAGLREGFTTIERDPTKLHELFNGLEADVLIEASLMETK